MGGVATKLAPLKLVLALDFHVGHNYGQHLFMNIDSRYSVGHHFLLARSGARAAVTSTTVAGYRRSHRGTHRRPIIRSITHAPEQTTVRPQPTHCYRDLAAPCRYDLTAGKFS